MPNRCRKYFTALLLFTSLSLLYAQKGLRIEAKITNAKPTILVLVQHFGGQLMPIDTAILNADGRIVWEQNELIPSGICRIMGIGRGIDVVVTDTQQFSFEADMKDIIATIRFNNSPENTLFFNYQRETRKRYQAALAYRQRMGIKDDSDPRWKTRFQELNEDIKRHVDSLYQKYPQSFAIRFLKSYQEPKLPILPLKQLSPKDSSYLQTYAWEHFFDNSSLSDERMIYTPTVPARFERFLKAIPQFPKEKIATMLNKTIQQTQGTVELRKYIIAKLAQKFELTPHPNFDELYGHLVEQYVENDPQLWDASTLQRVKEVRSIKDRLAIGNLFPHLILENNEGKENTLAEITSEYTVVFFYDPSCSHCREATPELVKLAKDHSDRMKIFAVTLDSEETPWKNFIKEFQTSHFVNVRDASRSIEFYKLGVLDYPTIYLLDRDKKIVKRWLNVEQLAAYFVSR